jgi:hypothetical protein
VLSTWTLPVIMITTVSGRSRLISRNTSRPEPSGRSISSKTAAGRSALNCVKASATEPASTGANPHICSASVSVQRIAWSSSTTSICSFVFLGDIDDSEVGARDYMRWASNEERGARPRAKGAEHESPGQARSASPRGTPTKGAKA